MYDELVKRLCCCADNDDCSRCHFETKCPGYDMIFAEAADAIEELGVVVRTQKAVLDKFPRWIPVTERLPEHHGHYLAHIISGEYQQVSWDEIAYFDGKGFRWEHSSEEYPEEITHWMNLPEPPKESEG